MNIRLTSPYFLVALLTITCFCADSGRAAEFPPVAVTLTTGDGAKLSARYHPSTRGEKAPTVIILDDIGDDAIPAICDDIARQLVKEGCAVLCFDFRGTGRSRDVEPEFWDDLNNRLLVKGFKVDDPPETIRMSDFKPGYLPTLVNDVAAARAFMERRNDARECNTNQIYVIGIGHGATLGQLWLASEWSRHRVSGTQSKLSLRPEGRDVAGCIWVGPQFALERQPVPMNDLLKRCEAKKSTLVGLLHDANDAEGARFAKQSQETYNLEGRSPLIAVRSLPHETKAMGARKEVSELIGKFLGDMRKVQDLPPWDSHNFVERRYVWAFRGMPFIAAKDEGDYYFLPIPSDLVLGRR